LLLKCLLVSSPFAFKRVNSCRRYVAAEFHAPDVTAYLAQSKIIKEIKNFFACAAFGSLGGNRVGYLNWITFCKKAGFVGKTLSITKLLRIFVIVADDMFDDYDGLDVSEAMALCKTYNRSALEEDMRFGEFAEGLARVGFDLMWGEGKKGKVKTLVEVIDEVLNVYLIKNEASIKKMKHKLR
jgi:hypothetical protein